MRRIRFGGSGGLTRRRRGERARLQLTECNNTGRLLLVTWLASRACVITDVQQHRARMACSCRLHRAQEECARPPPALSASLCSWQVLLAYLLLVLRYHVRVVWAGSALRSHALRRLRIMKSWRRRTASSRSSSAIASPRIHSQRFMQLELATANCQRRSHSSKEPRQSRKHLSLRGTRVDVALPKYVSRGVTLLQAKGQQAVGMLTGRMQAVASARLTIRHVPVQRVHAPGACSNAPGVVVRS
jgi:hypothetical protein